MREIFFKGRTTKGKEWVVGYFAVYSTAPFIGTPNKEGVMLWYEVDPETVGQFTGLTDKNGKRIFEGDLVKVLQGKDKGVAYVGFENGSFMLYPRTGNIYERSLWAYWYNDWDVEIIGNIHDNPELIGEREDNDNLSRN